MDVEDRTLVLPEVVLTRDRRVIERPPGSQHEEITRMDGFFDPAGFADDSRKRRRRCCLPLIHNTSAPR